MICLSRLVNNLTVLAWMPLEVLSENDYKEVQMYYGPLM